MKIHSVTIEVEDGSTKTMTVDEFKRFKKAFDRLNKIANPPEEKEQSVYDRQFFMMQQQQLEIERARLHQQMEDRRRMYDNQNNWTLTGPDTSALPKELTKLIGNAGF